MEQCNSGNSLCQALSVSKSLLKIRMCIAWIYSDGCGLTNSGVHLLKGIQTLKELKLGNVRSVM